MRTIVQVDQLDSDNNQLVGLLAFERLLYWRPDLVSHLRFLRFVVPSRADVAYEGYTDSMYREVARINLCFACTANPEPIEIFAADNPKQALTAMETCEVLLVSSTSDKASRVAREWATVSRRPGTLILPEAHALAADARDSALVLSRVDVQGTAMALAQALDIPQRERFDRLARLRRTCTGPYCAKLPGRAAP